MALSEREVWAKYEHRLADPLGGVFRFNHFHSISASDHEKTPAHNTTQVTTGTGDNWKKYEKNKCSLRETDDTSKTFKEEGDVVDG